MGRAKLAIVAVCVLTIAGLASFSWRATSVSALANCDTNSDALDSSEQEMLQLVNDARAAVGSAPLVVSPNLNRAAAWKSEDPESNGTSGFSHQDSLGRWPETRAPDCGYAGPAAENVAYGYGGARLTFDAFMGSPGHKANILNARYVAIGIGKSGWAWTLDFGFVDDSGAPAPAKAQPSPTVTPTPVPPTPTPVPQRYGVTMGLAAGTNLVGYSGPPMTVQAAMSSLGGSLAGVYWWDAANQKWLHYFPGAPGYANTLATVQPGFAYFIELSSTATWAY